MVLEPAARSEKPVHWIGSSKADLLTLPAEIVSALGYALGVAQLGGKHPAAKPWKGEGAGVFELVESFGGNAYRAIYTVRFEGFVMSFTCSRKNPRPAFVLLRRISTS